MSVRVLGFVFCMTMRNRNGTEVINDRSSSRRSSDHQCYWCEQLHTVAINKNFTFIYVQRSLFVRCERLRFVCKTVREWSWNVERCYEMVRNVVQILARG